MATVVEIERLQALVERLGPLAAKARGELIAADDWNTLVAALIEVGRATVATGQAGVPQHEHPDQVSIGWLDPQLRQIITGGGLKDPALDSTLIKLRRDVGLLDSRLSRVGDDLASTRTRVDAVATNDLTRSATSTASTARCWARPTTAATSSTCARRCAPCRSRSDARSRSAASSRSTADPSTCPSSCSASTRSRSCASGSRGPTAPCSTRPGSRSGSPSCSPRS